MEWLKAKNLDGKIILVKQNAPFSLLFVDKGGNSYYLNDLDFTSVEGSQKDNGYKDIAFANFMRDAMKSAENERAFWREFRSKLTLEVMQHFVIPDTQEMADKVKSLFDEIYKQDKEKFGD